MIASILSVAAQRNVTELGNIDKLIKAVGGRIASGKKVARPSDNPSAFFDASGLRSRAYDLNRVLDDIGIKQQTLKAADEALNAIINFVESAKSDLDTALASATPYPTATGTVVVSNQSDVTNLAGIADGDQFDIQVGAGAPVTITINSGDTATMLLNKIDAVANVDAKFTTEGFLQISATTNDDLILSETTNTLLAGLGITAGTFDASSSTSSFRTAKAADFDSVRTQIGQLAGDGSFKGVNLLNGDTLKITFNETGSSTLTITGVTFDAAGLGIAASVNNFQLDTDITAAKADLEAALDTLRDFSSSLSTNLSVAQTRLDFTTNIVGLLAEGADNLTLADLNEESATLLALQTRRDIALEAYSILQASESSILRLF